MIFNKDIDEKEFLTRITKITPEEFIALADVLAVKLSTVDKETGEYKLRDAEETLIECVNVFRRMPHKARKAILKAMSKSKGVTNGPTTEDSTN